MFGGPVEMPKAQRARQKLQKTDLLMPHPFQDGKYAHRAREPNTDYNVKMLHYKQREEEISSMKNDIFDKEKQLILVRLNQQTRAEQKRLRSKIQERLKEKLKEYEEQTEKRRDKLRDLLAEEEQMLIRETVEAAQRADANKIKDMKNKCEMIRATREAERLEFVYQKRLQQYADRCQDLRPFMVKKHLQETKSVQLQQMRENEARREAEREIDHMWEDVIRKQDEAYLDREKQEAIIRHQKLKKDMDILEMQVKAKKMMEAEMKVIEKENLEEMLRMKRQIEIEEEEDLKMKQMKRRQNAEELKHQLKLQQEFAAKRKQEDDAIENLLAKLSKLELEKEQAKILDNTERNKIEIAMYRQHLKELEEQKKIEEQKLDKLLEEYRIADQEKQNKRRCKIEEAKRKLQENVLEGRKQQLEYKRLEMEKQLKFKEEENNIIRSMLNTNKMLEEEANRLAVMATKQYRQDLKKQIEYNNNVKIRERENLELELKQGMEEEEKFRAIVNEIIATQPNFLLNEKHPFRRVLEEFDCHCPGVKM